MSPDEKSSVRSVVITIAGMAAILVAGILIAFAVYGARKDAVKAANEAAASAMDENRTPEDPLLLQVAEDVSQDAEVQPLVQAAQLMGPGCTQIDSLSEERVALLLEQAFVSAKNNSGSFAGLTFEEGTGETPVAITYGEIFAGTQAPYYRTGTGALEELIRGYFGCDYSLPAPQIAYQEIMNDGSFVTEWGEGYTQNGDPELPQLYAAVKRGSELVLKFVQTDETGINCWVTLWQENEDSVLGYSLAGSCVMSGNYGISPVSVTHGDCVAISEEIDGLLSGGKLTEVSAEAGADEIGWARDYYYDENGDLVLARLHDSANADEPDTTLYFRDGFLIRLMTEGEETADYCASECSGISTFQNWQKLVGVNCLAHQK